jgi:hypothetical protein
LTLAVRADPLDARIYSDLARVALLRGDPGRAGALFDLATARSRRLAAPEFWTFARAAEDGDYGAAWNAFDIVMRTQPGAVGARLFPAAATIAATPGGLAALSRRLAADPPWRTPFLLELGRRPATSGVLALILFDLRDTAHAATDEEIRCLLNGMIAAGDYQRAYASWIQLLPSRRLAAVGAVYNGRFRADAGEVPFNWTVPENAMGLVALGAGEGAREMRVVPFDRPATAAFVGQLLALTPGDYALRGSVRGSNAERVADDGLAWVLRCADTGQVLATSDSIAVADAWKRFVMPFTIPSESCGGQWLELHARPSLTSAAESGPVWFDDFSIAPARASAGSEGVRHG